MDHEPSFGVCVARGRETHPCEVQSTRELTRDSALIFAVALTQALLLSTTRIPQARGKQVLESSTAVRRLWKCPR